jgi:hypothetical protein
MPILRLRELNKIKRWNKYNVAKNWDKIQDIGRFTTEIGIRNGDKDGNWEKINNIWKNQPCYVVGGSKSARGFDLKLLDTKHSIGMNHMIEIYDKFKWFIFMDHRFLRITTYNLKNFKGKLFAHNNNDVLYQNYKDLYLFRCMKISQEPHLDISRGVYSRSLTGMVALHLAIFSGANPIYLIGMDEPKDYDLSEGIHYSANYTGEAKDKEKSKAGYDNLRIYFKKFLKFNRNIINCCEDGQMDFFKRMSIKELTENLQEGKINGI